MVGVVAIALVFRLGRTLFDRQVGWMAALLLATAGFFVRYGVETRMYSLLLCLAIFATWLFFRWSHRPTFWRALAYSLVAAGLGYTHYYGWLVVAGHWVWGILANKDRRLQKIGKHQSPFLLALFWYVPWMPAFYRQIILNPNGPLTTPVPTNWDAVGWLATLLAGGLGWWWLLLPIVGKPLAKDKNKFLLLLIWLGLTPIVVFGLNLWRPAIYETRYMVGIVPAFSLLTAYFIRHIQITPIKIVAIFAVLFWQIRSYPALFPANLNPITIETIIATRQDTDLSLVNLGDPASLAAYHNQQYGILNENSLDLATHDFTPNQLQTLVQAQTTPNIWLIMPYNIHSTWVTFAALAQERGIGYRAESQLLRFYRFDSSAKTEPYFTFGDQIAFQGTLFAHRPTLAANEPYCPQIQLQTLTAIDGRYSYGIHVVDEQYQLVGQADAGISPQPAQTTFTISGCVGVENAGNIPNTYYLHLVIYNWADSTRLPLLENKSIPWGDALIFDTVTFTSP
jgi:uncharacterized membrane protein